MKITAILIWTALCVGSGTALFTIAFAVEDLEEELTGINREIEQEREALHVLEAEWSYLTRPERIGALGAQLLPDLSGATVEQIVSLDDLPEPIPDPAIPGEQVTEEQVAAQPPQPRAPRVENPAPQTPAPQKPAFETLVRESLTQVRSTQ